MPVLDSNSSALASASPFARRLHDGIGQRMLAALVQARGQAQHLVGREAIGGQGTVEGRFAFGQRAGLVDDQRVDLAEVLDRRRVAEQDAARGRAPVATMMDIGVARPSAHGQAMISTATALISP
jgi:hypothetical protein